MVVEAPRFRFPTRGAPPGRQLDIGAGFATERAALAPLPVEVFETGLMLTPRVDRHARITVRTASYSVPARLVGRRVRVLLRASKLVVFDGRREVARHERSAVKGSTTLRLDHYLEVLTRKPGALPGATALAQARAGAVVHQRARSVLGRGPPGAR